MITHPVVGTVLSVSVLLFLASLLYLVNRSLRLPFSFSLVVVGLALGEAIRSVPALAPIGALTLSPELLTYLFLPTLVFQAAFATNTRMLLKAAVPILVLAIPSVLITTAVAGFALNAALGDAVLPLGAALLFGAIISSTDSTAVLTLFRELGAPKRLTILVDGENLLNDATAIVATRVVAGILGLAGGLLILPGETVVGQATTSFLLNFVGGLTTGLVIGYLFGRLLEYVENEDVIEILLTTVVAYLAFLIAELVIGVSGVMSTVGTGLVLSGWGRTKYSPATLQYLERFWDYLAFVATALVFLMVGLATDLRVFAGYAVPVSWAIAVSVLARAASIYGVFPLVNLLPRVQRAGLGYQTALVWGGLRGAITLALAMSLPADFVHRELFLTMAFGVVLFSLLVQGVTIEPMIHLLRINKATMPEIYVRDGSLLSAKSRARERLRELKEGGLFSDSVVGQLDESYQAEEQQIRQQIDQMRGGQLPGREELKLLKREYLLVEKRAYLDLFNRGQLSEKVLKDLQHSIEVQIDFLRSGGVLPSWTIHSPIRWQVERLLFRLLESVFPYSGFVQQSRLNAIADRYEEHWGRVVATERVLEELHRMRSRGGIASDVFDDMEGLYRRWNQNARARLDAIGEQFPEYATKVQQLMAARLGLQAEEEVIAELERLEILPEREARAFREEVSAKMRRLRQKPLEELAPRPSELLGRVPFFRGLPADEFERVTALLRPRTFLADEQIIQEGEIGESLFLIARGVVRIFVGGSGIPEVPIATLHAGDFFGEMAIVSGNPRNASVAAVTYCSLYELRRADLEAVQIVCPALQQVLEATASARARH